MSLPRVLPEIPALIASKREGIAALCREYGVARLEVFGSVMTDEFDPNRSDIDFLVEYVPDGELGWWTDDWYVLKAKLADIFGCQVDLVTFQALQDPFFRHFANLTRTVFYDGDDVVQIGAQPPSDRRSRDEDPGLLRRP